MIGKQYAPLTATEYSETFATFVEKLREKDEYETIVEPIFKEFGSKPVRFLSIGAGTGWMEDIFVTKYRLKMSFYYAIEPNPSHSEKLKDTITSWNVENTIDSGFFTSNMDIAHTFDVIFMAHCLYCIEDPCQAVIHAKSFLNPGGLLIILLQNGTGMRELVSHFKENATLVPDSFANHLFYDKDVFQFLTKSGINFQVKDDILGATLEIDDFVRQQSSKNVNDAISFILQK